MSELNFHPRKPIFLPLLSEKSEGERGRRNHRLISDVERLFPIASSALIRELSLGYDSNHVYAKSRILGKRDNRFVGVSLEIQR